MADTSDLKKLVKELQASSSPQDTVNVLNLLKKSVKATETLLRETKAGLAVGKLRTHASKEVADLAKELVRKWKSEVEAAKAAAAAASNSHSAPKPQVVVPTLPPPPMPQTKTPTTAASAASPSTPLSSTPTRNHKTDGVRFSTTHDKTRDKCVEMIYDALASDSTAPSDQILGRATNLEKAVYNAEGSSSGPYRAKMRMLYLNLKDKGNPSLRASVVSGDLPVARLATMSAADMASEERKQADQAIKEVNFHKSLGAGEPEAETSAFQCGRCKQWKTRYRQAQTRSADEPMTTFVTCVNCGARWKFS